MTVIQQTPPPRRHGCLWGCLAILAVFLLPVALAAGYGAWFWYEGFRRDPVLRGVVELVSHDGTAQQVLGQNIHIEGVEGSALAYVWARRRAPMCCCWQAARVKARCMSPPTSKAAISMFKA